MTLSRFRCKLKEIKRFLYIVHIGMTNGRHRKNIEHLDKIRRNLIENQSYGLNTRRVKVHKQSGKPDLVTIKSWS